MLTFWPQCVSTCTSVNQATTQYPSHGQYVLFLSCLVLSRHMCKPGYNSVPISWAVCFIPVLTCLVTSVSQATTQYPSHRQYALFLSCLALSRHMCKPGYNSVPISWAVCFIPVLTCLVTSVSQATTQYPSHGQYVLFLSCLVLSRHMCKPGYNSVPISWAVCFIPVLSCLVTCVNQATTQYPSHGQYVLFLS